MGEYDVTIVKAGLFHSHVTGLPAISLTFSPHELCFREGRVVNKIFCGISNIAQSLAGIRRVRLRDVLGISGLAEPFTEEELRSIIGRRIRVEVDTMKFEGVERLRVVDFLRYSGKVKDLNYSDNEYVFMIRELIGRGVRNG